MVRAIDIAAPVAGVTMCASAHSRIFTNLMCVQQDQIRGEVVPEVPSCAFAGGMCVCSCNFCAPGAKPSPRRLRRQPKYGRPRYCVRRGRVLLQLTLCLCRFNLSQASAGKAFTSPRASLLLHLLSCIGERNSVEFDSDNCSASDQHALLCDNYGVTVICCLAACIMRIVIIIIIIIVQIMRKFTALQHRTFPA